MINLKKCSYPLFWSKRLYKVEKIEVVYPVLQFPSHSDAWQYSWPLWRQRCSWKILLESIYPASAKPMINIYGPLAPGAAGRYFIGILGVWHDWAVTAAILHQRCNISQFWLILDNALVRLNHRLTLSRRTHCGPLKCFISTVE